MTIDWAENLSAVLDRTNQELRNASHSLYATEEGNNFGSGSGVVDSPDGLLGSRYAHTFLSGGT